MDKIYIYADESAQDGQKFMLLGGIAVKGAYLKEFEKEIDQLRVSTNMSKELKWSKVTNQKVEEYRQFIELFFRWNDAGNVTFHCMILETAKISYPQFGGSYELGFYKFFYQLLLHTFGKKYGQNNDLYVFLDQRQTGYALDDLRRILNNGMKSRYGIDRRPFRLVEFADSKKSGSVQIADIVLGSLGFHKNEFHLRPDAKPSKKELSEFVMQTAQLRDGLPNTPFSRSRFTVWNFALKEKYRASPPTPP